MARPPSGCAGSLIAAGALLFELGEVIRTPPNSPVHLAHPENFGALVFAR